MRSRLLIGLVASVGLAACAGPPTTRPDAGTPSFDWTVALAEQEAAILSVSLASPTEVVAVGGDVRQGAILEWTGTEWRSPWLDGDTGLLWWVHSWPGGDAVTVGESATVLWRSGGAWRRLPLGDVVDARTTFYGVWGAPDDLWLVGGSLVPGATRGVIVHFDGTTFSVVTDEGVDTRLLFKVWGAATDAVFAVGEQGAILHWDGAAWTAADSTIDDRLVAVFGRAADEVYAVGGDALGVVLAWDGASWREWATSPEPLSGVFTAPGRALYAGGNRGLLLRYGDETDGLLDATDPQFALPVDDVDFHALSGAAQPGGLVLAAGVDLFGGGASSWRGALYSHAGSLAGPVVVVPGPDAGPDAPPPLPDAEPPIDAFIDAAPDAAWPIAGETCAVHPMTGPYCATGLTCWVLLFTDTFICTETCDDATTCDAFGAGACCTRPGPQTLETVCVPQGFVECP
ncbi:MAG: hypothetical protein EXR73_08605 [Myxococcales bacterium]|nr:hypothetical protein [Myxococcales bacterium]